MDRKAETVRQVLRTRTRECHSALDSLVGNGPALNTEEGYQHYLLAMSRLFHFFGKQVEEASKWAQLPSQLADIQTRIDSDLPFDNMRPIRDSWPRCLETQESNCWTWGVAYTLEGSAMGAGYMLRSADSTLPKCSRTDFLSLMSENAQQRWPTFCEALEKGVLDREVAVAGATEAFRQAYAIFDTSQPGHYETAE